MGSLEATVAGAAPYAALHAVTFFAARALGPKLFEHCRKLDGPGRSYWASSVCSTLNGFVVTPLAWLACKETNLLAPDASFWSTSPLSYAACYGLIGYTALDFIPLVVHRNDWSGVGAYIVHHLGSILSWGICATTGALHNVAVPVCLLEGTAPFVNGRYFLSTAGYKDTTLYMVNGALMALSFFLLRVCLNWYLFLTRIFWQHAAFSTLPLYMQLLFYPLMSINLSLQLFWFWKIVTGIYALLYGKADKPKSR